MGGRSGRVRGGVRNRIRKQVAWVGRFLSGSFFTLLHTACDDPYAVEWIEYTDTLVLYSMARPELNLATAFDFLSGARMPVESVGAIGQWDVVLDTMDGDLMLSPPGVFGIESEARISVMEGVDFWDVVRAPGDSLLYVTDVPVPLNLGTVYVIGTRQVTDGYGNSCVYYAKMEPIVLNLSDETMTFHFLLNPTCNDTWLVSK